MRNLRKYFAVFVAVALLVTAIAPAFAADTAAAATTSAPAALSDAKICETVGVLVGDGSGVTDAYLASTPSKLQAAIMFLRLKGLEKEATAFKGTENFKDADKVDWDAGKAILAYLKANATLGFVGNPDGTFDPNAAITAQQYYKILLVALGYVEGKDFKYDDTLKFAETKGLKKAAASTKFSINDVAIATVEALKANTADGKKTLVQALVDSKALDAKKAADATLIAGSGPASSFDLTAKTAKTLYAKLNGVVADTAKVTIDVTRDAGIKATLTATWDKDKAGVILSTDTNLVAGDYTVAIKDDKTDLGKKTVKIEQEKLAKIEMVSKSITRRSDSEGVAYYKVTNQYGDDVTKAPIASNIQWNSSLGTYRNNGVTADKGVLTFVKNDNLDDNSFSVYMGLLKDQKSVVVTAYDSDSNITANESLTVSETVGDIQSLKLLGISNKDKKTKIEKQTTDVFYIDFEAKDSNGNLVTDYKIFSNTSAFRLSPGVSNESTIAWAEVVQDPNDNKQAKFQIKVPQSTTAIAGTQIVSAICIATGKSANFQIDVVEGSVLQQLILQKPSQDVAIGDGFVEIPYLALDSNGAALTEYSKIKTDKLALSGIDSSKTKMLQNPDGSFKLLVDFGTQKTQYTLSATVNTTTTVKMSTITVSVKDAAYPKSIISLDDKKFVPALVYGAKTGDKLDKTKILDQYDRPLNLRHYSNRFTVTENNTNTDYYFYVRATIGSSNSDSQLNTISLKGEKNATTNKAVYKQVAYGNGLGIDLFANGTTGSVSVNFELVKALAQPVRTGNSLADTEDVSAKSVDSKIFTFYNVDKKDIQSYYIDEMKPLLYANESNWKANELTAANAAGTPIDRNDNYDGTGKFHFKDTWFGEAMSDAKIRGKYNGMRVAIVDKDQASGGDIVSYEVSDTSKFQTFFQTNKLKGDYKVWAKKYTANNDPQVGVLTVAVKGYQGVITTAKADLKSETTMAAAKEVGVDFEDGISVDAVDSSKISFRPVVSLGTTGDVFKVTAAYAQTYLAGVGVNNAKRIYQYSYATKAPGNDSVTGGADIIAADQGYKYAEKQDCNIAVNPVRSSIFFYVADQYGKKSQKPTTLSAVSKDVNGNIQATQNINVDSDTGMIWFTQAPVSGESYTFTAISANGLTKAITIYIDDSTDYVHSYK